VTQGQIAIDIINWGVNVGFVVTFTFPGWIRLIWKWTESDWGWNTVALDMAVAVALLPSWVHRVFNLKPDTYLFIWIVAGSLWAILIIVIWRAYIIYRIQRHGGRRASTRPKRVPAKGESSGD